MKADQARKKTYEVNTQTTGSQLAQIRKMISDAVSKGEYKIWFYDVIIPDVRAQLTKDGFFVDATQFERNETMTEIKW